MIDWGWIFFSNGIKLLLKDFQQSKKIIRDDSGCLYIGWSEKDRDERQNSAEANFKYSK